VIYSDTMRIHIFRKLIIAQAVRGVKDYLYALDLSTSGRMHAFSLFDFPLIAPLLPPWLANPLAEDVADVSIKKERHRPFSGLPRSSIFLPAKTAEETTHISRPNGQNPPCYFILVELH